MAWDPTQGQGQEKPGNGEQGQPGSSGAADPYSGYGTPQNPYGAPPPQNPYGTPPPRNCQINILEYSRNHQHNHLQKRWVKQTGEWCGYNSSYGHLSELYSG